MAMPDQEDLYSDFQSDDGAFGEEADGDLRSEGESDDVVAGAVDVQPEPLNREEKKKKRYDDLLREVEDLKAKVSQPVAPYPSHYQFAPPQQLQEDPELAAIRQRLDQNDSRRLELEQLYQAEQARGNVSPERHQQIRKQYKELEDERHEMLAYRVSVKSRPSPQQQAEYARRVQIQTRYPDIVNDTRAYAHASALMQLEMTRNPDKALDWSDYDRIAEQTRIDLGKKAAPVSDATKARHSSHGAGGNGSKTSGDEFPMKLDAGEAQMAREAYRDIVRDKGLQAAYRQFWKDVKLPELRARKNTG